MKFFLPAFILLAFGYACSTAESGTPGDVSEVLTTSSDSSCNCQFNYRWMDSSQYDPKATICTRFGLAKGFTRVKNTSGSFGEWLRGLPLFPEGTQVKLYNGELKGNQGAQAAVINIDVGKTDLQQCADAVMRLRAEYLFATKQYDKIAFNFTSGDRLEYSNWTKGKRIKVNPAGTKTIIAWDGEKHNVANHEAFRLYMNSIFCYAGTLSLSREMKSIPLDSMKPGDVFIHGGTPGHAVLIVDMAVNVKGEKLFMMAQSYMPAQQIHVLKNDVDKKISPWYKAGAGDELDSPEYVFSWDELKRF